MFNSYLKLFPDGCQLKFYHYKNDNPVKECSRGETYCDQAHSDYVSLSRSKKRIHDLARSNDFSYFVTLTFNPEKVDSFSWEDSSTHMQNWLKNIRRRYPDLKYLGVPELHKSGRFHFHFLMSADIVPSLVDSGKRDKGHIIYNVGSYRLGFSTAIRIYDKAKVPNYMVKYITKDLKDRAPNKRRYWASHNLDMPKNYATYFDMEDFSVLLEKLNVTYSTKRESDFSYCDIYEVDYDSLSILFPHFDKISHEFSSYDGIPAGFFPLKSTLTPFD